MSVCECVCVCEGVRVCVFVCVNVCVCRVIYTNTEVPDAGTVVEGGVEFPGLPKV